MSQEVSRRDCLSFATTLAAGSVALSAANSFAQTSPEPNVNPTADNPIRAMYNENVYGQAIEVQRAMQEAVRDSHVYVEDYEELIGLMSELENVPREYVYVGAGSTEFLRDAVVFTHVEGGAIVVPDPTFTDFFYFTDTLGTKVIKVPVSGDMSIDLEAIKAAVTDEVKLVYLCNPNNPIPTIIEKNALKTFIAEMAGRDVSVLVDEAYYEYVDNSDYESMIPLVLNYKNVIVTRTASKIHGFAGVRFGACFAHPDYAQKAYGLHATTLGQVAVRGALACYKNKEHPAFIKQKNIECQQIMYEMLEELDLEYVKSNANFVYFNTGKSASEVKETMEKHHILIGMVFEPFTNWARISLTKPEEMQYVADKYRELFA